MRWPLPAVPQQPWPLPRVSAQYERERRHRRGSTAQGGYGRAWQELRKAQLARQPYCADCGATADLTVDHIVPLARGGRGELSNLQTLCRRCNGIKAAN